MPRPAPGFQGPWPDLSAYARQPARGPTMLAHFVAMLAYVGVCCPILRAMWAHLVAMLAYVGLMLTHVEAKEPKNGNSKKYTVKRRIFWCSAAYLGAMLAYLGAMLAYLEGHVGPSWGYVGPSWGYVGPSWGYGAPSWGYVGPSWGLCWPMLVGAMLAYLEAYVGPCWPILSHKLRKMGKNGKSTKHRRRETPTAMPRPGGPWPDLRAATLAVDVRKKDRACASGIKQWKAVHMYIPVVPHKAVAEVSKIGNL